MVVEADESDGTFLKLPADVAIVTNVDPEHLDHFKTFEAVQEAFRAFVENVPFYGFAVMCTDHPVVQLLVGQITDRRIITYGENLQADVRLADLDHADGQSRFSIVFRDRAGETSHEIKGLTLPMPGRHNALNATAAIAVAHELGVSDDTIRKALQNFGGVRRRFTRTGEWNGVPIIDDYGHHPVEIEAVLRAAREFEQGPGDRRGAAASLHAGSPRLFEQFSTCFNDADTVIVAHVYAGRRGADPRRRPRLAGAGPARARASPGHSARRPRRISRAWSSGWRSAATSWCSSAPATSRNGPMRCRASSPRSARWRDWQEQRDWSIGMREQRRAHAKTFVRESSAYSVPSYWRSLD